MRIIAGEFRSRNIVSPKGERTRPTSDRARESLFNVLAHAFDLDGAKVLDLFAGSGALGFEALSRGAAHVTFIEHFMAAREAIDGNIRALNVKERTDVVKLDVYKWLPVAVGPYDIVFADPPYDDKRTRRELPELLFREGLLTPESLVIIEHRTGTTIAVPQGARKVRDLDAGEAAFTFLQTA
jgi:16S rRNA (guanine966-N2)-methyltransferase